MTVIKRYSNRKLYDTEAGRYVTLEEMGERIHNGEEISVIDHDTGADLTALTLMQVVFEREKKLGGMMPKAILTSLIQAGNLAVESLRTGLNSMRENPQQVEGEIRRRLNVLLADGQLAAEEAQRLAEMMLAPKMRQAETRDTLGVDANAADPVQVDALQKQIADLEAQIANIKSRNQQS